MRYAGAAGERRSSGEHKANGDAQAVSDAAEISFPLAHAIVSVNDADLTFTIDVPPNTAKYSEFQFRCTDASELLKWYTALVAASQPGNIVRHTDAFDEADLAFRTSLMGFSTAECKSLGSESVDLMTRSLPTKLDVSLTIHHFHASRITHDPPRRLLPAPSHSSTALAPPQTFTHHHQPAPPGGTTSLLAPELTHSRQSLQAGALPPQLRGVRRRADGAHKTAGGTGERPHALSCNGQSQASNNNPITPKP